MLILKKNQTNLASFIASHLSNLALNELTVFASTILLGNLFHHLLALFVKNAF